MYDLYCLTIKVGALTEQYHLKLNTPSESLKGSAGGFSPQSGSPGGGLTATYCTHNEHQHDDDDGDPHHHHRHHHHHADGTYIENCA